MSYTATETETETETASATSTTSQAAANAAAAAAAAASAVNTAISVAESVAIAVAQDNVAAQVAAYKCTLYTATATATSSSTETVSATVNACNGVPYTASGTASATVTATESATDFTPAAANTDAANLAASDSQAQANANATAAAQVIATNSATALANAVNCSRTATSLSLTVSQSTSSGVPVTLTATITGGATGTLSFLTGSTVISACASQPIVSGVATCVTSSLPLGSNSFTASYAGNTTYAPSTSNAVVFNVMNGSVTLISASPTSSTYKNSVTLTATVTTGATGLVTFYDGGSTTITGCTNVALSAGTATCTTASLLGGTHTLSASYLGDSTHIGSTSSPLTFVVLPAPSSTTLTASPTSSTFGSSVVLTAVVSSQATGTVAFKVGGAIIGSCGTAILSAGIASCTTSALQGGSNSLTAVYSGNSNYSTSTSGVVFFTVSPTSSTTTLSASPTSSTSGGSVTLTATVSSQATGTVNFMSNNAAIQASCTGVMLSAGVATCTTTALTVGTDALKAAYSGNANRVPSTSSSIAFVVAPIATTTTTLSIIRQSLVAGYPVELTATESPASSGTFLFLSNGASISCTYKYSFGSTSCLTEGLPPGTNSIAAYFVSSNPAVGNSNSAPILLPVWIPVVFSGSGQLPEAAISTVPQIVGLVDQYMQGEGRYSQAQITLLNQAAIPDAIAFEYSIFDSNGTPTGPLAYVADGFPNYLPELIVDAIAPYISMQASQFTSCFSTDTNNCFVNTVLPAIDVRIEANINAYSCFLGSSCYTPSYRVNSPTQFDIDWTAAMYLFYAKPWSDLYTELGNIDPDYPDFPSALEAWAEALGDQFTWGLAQVDIGGAE